jgi:hypothetical protein
MQGSRKCAVPRDGKPDSGKAPNGPRKRWGAHPARPPIACRRDGRRHLPPGRAGRTRHPRPLRSGGDGCRSADDQRTILGPVPCSLSRCLPHSVTLLRARRQRLRRLLRPIGNFAASQNANNLKEIRPGQGRPRQARTKTDKIEVFIPPEGMAPTGGAVTVDYDGRGMIWVSSPTGALRFDPTTEKFTEYKSPTPKSANGGVGCDLWRCGRS